MYTTSLSRPYMLRVSSRTWLRDSHDLFDYETHQHVKVSHFATSCPLKVLRNDSEVSVIDYNNNVDREHDHLLNIVCNRNGDYIVAPAEKIQGSLLSPQKLWLIVRTLPSQRYALQENDIIKLGRFRLRVKQLVAGPNVETPDSSSDHTMGYSDSGYNCDETNDSQIVKLFDGVIPDKTITFEEQCNIQCRICLSEGYLHYPSSDNTPNTTPANNSSNDTSLDVDSGSGKMDIYSHPINSNTSSLDPSVQDTSIDNLEKRATFESDRLICACECKGSIKYVHVECLRKWIDSKWSLRGEDPLPSIVFIKEVSCELCKTNYPCFIRQNGELIQIVKMPKMQTPFLVLENTTPQAVRGVHLVSMRDSKDLKLGRGHESDLRIPDVSISRYHANIRYENGQFYLEDHDSKFGTLVAMKRSRIVSSDEPLAVQVGRSVINLTVDKSLPYFEKTWLTLTPSNPPADYTNFEAPNAGNHNVDMNLNSAPVFGSQAVNGMIPTPNLVNVNNIPNVNNMVSGSIIANGGNMTNGNNIANGGNMNNGNFGNPINITNLTGGPNGVNVHPQGMGSNSSIGIDLMEHPMHPSGYMTFYQPSYTNPVHIPSPNNSNSISSRSNNFTFQPGSNTPTASANINNGNVAAGHPLPSPSSRVSPLNDLYWGCLREAARQRFDPHALDGLANNRLNSFRLNPLTSSRNMGNTSPMNGTSMMSNGNTMMSNSAQMNPGSSSSSGMGMNNSGEDLDMLLPDTVFIANWNNLPTRNLDLNGDTSTSALEHRHSSQDLDKPITRI
ncbi:FHA domain protein, putative [Theileria annulata]|uniref:FHA domain protein, putative n=1 Tax=Theileria annulata TaxID=5874 RepID=Q4UH28_THEAN|nr:FHA domain protein, putative [Theileria annulata]CAI73611.1 FHA domain protein, putative [Theileria annulata]|eukprot:XP_954288.1 FHA domain protein, putative [Theileria annulata]